MWLSSNLGIEILEDQVLRMNSSKKEILRPRVTWSLVAWWRELWELKYKKGVKVSDKKMTKQTKKCQAHYSCVEHNIMYKTQFSMRKRNDSPTYKPEAKRRLREAQGQQKDEALIKEGCDGIFFSF